MKKQFLSPVFTIVAMLLVVVPKLIRREPLHWESYGAIVVIIIGSVGIYLEYRKIK